MHLKAAWAIVCWRLLEVFQIYVSDSKGRVDINRLIGYRRRRGKCEIPVGSKGRQLYSVLGIYLDISDRMLTRAVWNLGLASKSAWLTNWRNNVEETTMVLRQKGENFLGMTSLDPGSCLSGVNADINS